MLRRLRVGLLATHPIQYLSPWLRELAQRCELRVFYAHRQSADDHAESGYGVAFDWDSDLLTGYEHHFLANAAQRPDVSRFDGCNCPELSGIIGGGGFDAFLVMGWHSLAYWQAIAECRARRIPVFARGDSQLRTPRKRMTRALKHIVTRWTVAQFDGFLSVGSRNREYLLHYGAADDRIFFVPHHVDTAYFHASSRLSPAERQSVRANLGARTDELVIISVGRLIRLKRPHDLVRAAARARQRIGAVRVVFVGAGPLAEELDTLARSLAVPVTFAGFRNQSELPPIYAAADLLALCSEWETWGLVVNEAMSCNLPVVVSDVAGSSADMVVPHETGLSYPAGDVAKLAEAIVEIACLRRRHDFAPALEAMCARFSCKTAADNTLEALHTVIGRMSD